MELRENLQLVNVEYESDGKKAVLTFLDKERREVRTVNFNQQTYKDGKYIDDPEKAEKVEEWCKEFFMCSFKELPKQIGTVKDVYCYEKFNSLFPVDTAEKFTADQLGDIINATIKEIVVDDNAIRIRYEDNATQKLYESKMSYAIYEKNMNLWFVDPLKKQKQYEKFKEKFGVDVDQKDTLVGHQIIVEVRIALGKYYYGDIKKFPKKG